MCIQKNEHRNHDIYLSINNRRLIMETSTEHNRVLIQYHNDVNDNKELLFVSLLEKLCDDMGNKKTFRKACNYLFDNGVIENKSIYSKSNGTMRSMCLEYLINMIHRMSDSQDAIVKRTAQRDDVTKNDDIKFMRPMYCNMYTEIEQIGAGGFGEVYKVYNKIDQCRYAIKKIPFLDATIDTTNCVPDMNTSIICTSDNDQPSSDQFGNFASTKALNEVRCLSMLSHKNIVRYYDTWIELCDDKPNVDEYDSSSIEQRNDTTMFIYPVLYIQMELCACSLKDYIVKRNYSGRELNEQMEKKMIIGIMDGMRYIHENNIIHRDINPNNIFVDNNGIPKIGDFGMSVNLEHHRNIPKLSSGYGVELYMPPEYKKDGTYTKASDMYSIGIVMFELFHIMTTDMERVRTIIDIKNGSYPEKFVMNCKKYYDIVTILLCPDIDGRMTSSAVYDKLALVEKK